LNKNVQVDKNKGIWLRAIVGLEDLGKKVEKGII